MRGLGRGMGIMAIRTAFLHWVVLEFYFCNDTPDLLMAVNTELISCPQKNKFIL